MWAPYADTLFEVSVEIGHSAKPAQSTVSLPLSAKTLESKIQAQGAMVIAVLLKIVEELMFQSRETTLLTIEATIAFPAVLENVSRCIASFRLIDAVILVLGRGFF